MSAPLTASEIEDQVEESLHAVLSSRRTAEPLARALAEVSRQQQEFVLHWIGVIVKTNAEMGYQFAAHAVDALKVMELTGAEEWLIHAMDVYDHLGLYPACAALRDYTHFAELLAAREVNVDFQEIAGVLKHFVAGLSGRRLQLAIDKHVWTDTETLFLPERIALMPTREQNFQLYKAMVSYLWAQLWFGTFRRSGAAATGVLDNCAEYPEPERALELFQQLEAVRLNARIESELSGLYREMCGLQAELGNIEYPVSWQDVLDRLRAPQATIQDTYHALREVYGGQRPTGNFCYQGQMQAGRTEAAMQERIAQEKRALRNHLHDMAQDLRRAHSQTQRENRFSAQVTQDDDWSNNVKLELALDGEHIAPPDAVKELLHSVLQDLGDIPDDYLVPAGDGEYRSPGERRTPDALETSNEEGAYLYNEWDYRRQHYRKDWCMLREIDVHPSEGTFVADTLERYGGLVAELRRTFEILRGEDKLLKRQKDGDDIDLDAVVEAFTDAQAGREMSNRLMTKLNKSERDVAVVFMVDMSGSTKGWINEAERESLVLLCEALEILGDRYAIFGFSGLTRKRCELYRVKAFSDPYDDLVRQRISGIKPQDYTRMGVVIRHLTQMFRHVEARTKLLVTLSDGMPDDYDGYRGKYGIEDTRQALIEAKHEGIHPFCITIDTEAKDYLPHMYGAVNYTLVDQVLQLPFKVSDIYRQLTT